jgi:hypothetical protein
MTDMTEPMNFETYQIVASSVVITNILITNALVFAALSEDRVLKEKARGTCSELMSIFAKQAETTIGQLTSAMENAITEAKKEDEYMVEHHPDKGPAYRAALVEKKFEQVRQSIDSLKVAISIASDLVGDQDQSRDSG